MNYVMTIMVSLTSQQDYTRCVVGSVKLSLFQTQFKQKKAAKAAVTSVRVLVAKNWCKYQRRGHFDRRKKAIAVLE
jgi:hypothetical protein